MRKIVFVFFFWVVILNLNGCVSLKKVHKIYAPKVFQGEQAQMPTFYSEPRVYAAVADFEIKTAKANNEMGSGLRQMLITALIKDGYFSILGRQDLSRVAEPAVKPEAAAQKADFIIAVTVIEFESQISGGNDGVGGGGGLNDGRFGGLLGETLNKAHLSMNVGIINASTSAMLATTVIQGQVNANINKPGISELSDSGELDSRLSGYINTPMGKAIRECINEAARYIEQTVKRKPFGRS